MCVYTIALVECHKIGCLTIEMMRFGSKTNAPKDGLKIRVMALPPGPSLFHDDFALNGVLRRRSPFKRGAMDKNASSPRPQTAIGGAKRRS